MVDRTRRFGGATIVIATVVLAVAGVAAAAVGVIDHIDDAAAQPSQRAVRVDPPTPAVVIGDSAISALRWFPGADNAIIGFDHTLDLESCRRLVGTSCRGREGRTPSTAHRALAEHAPNHTTAIIATGYNDEPSTFEATFDTVIARARSLGYERIIWWTLRSDVDYVSPGSVGDHEGFAAMNAILREKVASGSYPDVTIADWQSYTAERAEWFVTDGVHYRAVGTWGAADYLSRKMAFLDERPCPFPERPGDTPEHPCPDPDETGQRADIEALYPIGADGVLCYEVGSERRLECRHDTHVIRLDRWLEFGMSGVDVGALQTRLVRLGYLVGQPNNEFEAGTQMAVSNFQAVNSLAVSGVADHVTLAAMGFDVTAVPPGSAPATTTTTTTTTTVVPAGVPDP